MHVSAVAPGGPPGFEGPEACPWVCVTLWGFGGPRKRPQSPIRQVVCMAQQSEALSPLKDSWSWGGMGVGCSGTGGYPPRALALLVKQGKLRSGLDQLHPRWSSMGCLLPGLVLRVPATLALRVWGCKKELPLSSDVWRAWDLAEVE